MGKEIRRVRAREEARGVWWSEWKEREKGEKREVDKGYDIS